MPASPRVRNTNRVVLDSYRGADGIKTGLHQLPLASTSWPRPNAARCGSSRPCLAASLRPPGATKRIMELLDLGFAQAPARATVRRPSLPVYGPDDDDGPVGNIARASGLVSRSIRPLQRPGAVPRPLVAAAPPPELVSASRAGRRRRADHGPKPRRGNRVRGPGRSSGRDSSAGARSRDGRSTRQPASARGPRPHPWQRALLSLRQNLWPRAVSRLRRQRPKRQALPPSRAAAPGRSATAEPGRSCRTRGRHPCLVGRQSPLRRVAWRTTLAPRGRALLLRTALKRDPEPSTRRCGRSCSAAVASRRGFRG